MSQATLEAPAVEPLRDLVEDWNRSEASRAEDLQRLLEPLEQAVSQLSEWADRVAVAEQREEEARREAASKEQAADARRRRLEHDLKLARQRVTELEQLLQDRTEELLRMQAANNRLAAELREIGDDEPLASDALGDPIEDADGDLIKDVDGDLMAIAPEDEELADFGAAEPIEGVAERFARLRQN
jgi:chromosome segregation ATPase